VSTALLQLSWLTETWVTWLPDIVLRHLTPLSLIVLGYLVEKQYVSRPAIFANAVAVNAHVYEAVRPHTMLEVYANLGLVMAALAIYSYESGSSLREEYYGLAQLYSSWAVAGVVFVL